VQPHNEFRFHPHVVQIGCYWGDGAHTELYLLEGDTLAIVDTGVRDTPSRYIGPALESCGHRFSDVELILSTHGHYDHTGGNAEMVAASGAKLWIHEADARSAEEPDYQFETYFTSRHLLAGRPDRLEGARVAFNANVGQPTKVDRKLVDGEVIDLGKGVRLRVVPVPGHTPGSVCYAWESEGLVLAGDAVMGLSPHPGGLPLIYYPADYKESLERLQAMDMAVLGIGHHYRTLKMPADSVYFREGIKTYLGACQEIADVIEDGMRRARRAHPGAGFLEVARAATDLISERLQIKKSEEGLPIFGNVESFYGYWQMLQ
jgi:glyoxylase-like metal-dependent hydrolase (beta-lactamase superfamily II)